MVVVNIHRFSSGCVTYGDHFRYRAERDGAAFGWRKRESSVQ